MRNKLYTSDYTIKPNMYGKLLLFSMGIEIDE